MNVIAPPQLTSTLRKMRIAIAITGFNSKCERPFNFATPYHYATITNTSNERSPDLAIWAGEQFYD